MVRWYEGSVLKLTTSELARRLRRALAPFVFHELEHRAFKRLSSRLCEKNIVEDIWGMRICMCDLVALCMSASSQMPSNAVRVRRRMAKMHNYVPDESAK
jgi:hypothetical protein